MTGEDFSSLVIGCELLNLHSELKSFFNTIREKVLVADPSVFHVALLPGLASLLRESKVQGKALDIGRYQKFFSAVLEAYRRRYVTDKPVRPKAWSRQRRGCGNCNDSQSLDNFLISTEEKEKRFYLNKQRREHVVQRLKPSHCHVIVRATNQQALYRDSRRSPAGLVACDY